MFTENVHENVNNSKSTNRKFHLYFRACPECRVCSDFVCPSAFWVETKEEKDKLLNDYRAALGAKDCKYFKKGEGKCPFGNKCFYKHALPNGDIVDVGLPKRARKLHSQNELIDLLDVSILCFGYLTVLFYVSKASLNSNI